MELPQVTHGEPFHDSIAEVLPHHQEEGDGQVVVALVVVEAGLSLNTRTISLVTLVKHLQTAYS